jgi:hypothetical protein
MAFLCPVPGTGDAVVACLRRYGRWLPNEATLRSVAQAPAAVKCPQDKGAGSARDAVHLAAASAWQATLGERVTLAAFDRHLWAVARLVSLDAYPAGLPPMIEGWWAARKPVETPHPARPVAGLDPPR